MRSIWITFGLLGIEYPKDRKTESRGDHHSERPNAMDIQHEFEECEDIVTRTFPHLNITLIYFDHLTLPHFWTILCN